MELFLDALQETKRVHVQKVTDLAYQLIKLLTDFSLYEDDSMIIADLNYEIMMAESLEKADIECVVEKFNVKMSRMYIVEIEHHCTNYSARKLKGIGINCKSRNLNKLGHKIERIEEQTPISRRNNHHR
jgi:hypothetical protein